MYRDSEEETFKKVAEIQKSITDEKIRITEEKAKLAKAILEREDRLLKLEQEEVRWIEGCWVEFEKDTSCCYARIARVKSVYPVIRDFFSREPSKEIYVDAVANFFIVEVCGRIPRRTFSGEETISFTKSRYRLVSTQEMFKIVEKLSGSYPEIVHEFEMALAQ